MTHAPARLRAGPVVAAVVLLAAGCGAGGTADAGPATPTPSARAPEVAAATPAPRAPAPPALTPVTDAPTAPRRLRPVRLRVPAIGVDAPVTELGIDRRGRIEVPDVAADAGWLRTTPAPGERGPAVVAGHLDSDTGPAVFYRLAALDVGDAVIVTRRDGTTARFTVDGVRTYPQDRFPTRTVYGPVPGPALRLVTCGGDYDAARGGYQANVVVYAS
ncbi:hypothetical protein GCM10023340_03350 [Nocardioides marinquilinus]|uniref:Class F sortase n=1 Tax=Nocardioides marinquilinus TaxID=1210400 RepID=A0ABP9P9M9_9ACTN